MVLAQEEGRLLHDSSIGTEHLLLGLLREERGLAGELLISAGVSLQSVRNLVQERSRRSDTSFTGELPLTPRAKRVLDLSMAEALRLGHDRVDTEHLLLGLLRGEEGPATEILVALGVDLGAVTMTALDAGQAPSKEGISTSTTLNAPICPGCRASLRLTIRYADLVVPRDSQSQNVGDQNLRKISVFYCQVCALTLLTALEPKT